MGALRFPDFLGIGAQKAGTTWLYRNLGRHPDVWMPPVKELHYFDQLYVDTPGHQRAADERRRKRADRALARLAGDGKGPDGGADVRAASLIASGTISDEWYGSIFALAPAGSICGEITGSYALLPDDGVDHLVRLNPDVKIVFLLRDPIERAVAHVQMLHRRGSPHDQREFQPLPTLELDPRVLSRSRYSETLRRFRRRIDERSIWIGQLDELAADPRALLRGLCSFLGLEFDERFFPNMHQQVHVGMPRDLGNAAYERLKSALEPEYDELARIVPESAAVWRARHYG